MAKRYWVCAMLVVTSVIGSGCHRRHFLHEHRYYHRNHLPYEAVSADSCGCGVTANAPPVIYPSTSPTPAVEIIPAPKAMPKVLN